jgi:hypothetical protein
MVLVVRLLCVLQRMVEGRVTDVVMCKNDSKRIVGVKWVGTDGSANVSLAPLSVLSDGYYSVLRKVRNSTLWTCDTMHAARAGYCIIPCAACCVTTSEGLH